MIKIKEIENELYSLVSQIDYGDVSDIDVYWQGLATAMLKLKIDKWKKPKLERNGTISVSALLDTLPMNVSNLFKITKDMEKLSEGGSNGNISEGNLDKLKSLAIDFEDEFEKLLKKLQ